ncbi:MAG: sigma-54 dependent transcriptional regulator [OM182 bacterium]|nr:sigma-54 dependent transcriptional regulator [OM182 bacterium]
MTLSQSIAKIGKIITIFGNYMNIIQSDGGSQSTLSAMLEGYDCPAILVSANYEILAYNSEYREAFGALELDQQPNCYNVSHGYNVPCDQAGESCPLSAALVSQRKERVLHIHQTPHGKEHVDVEMLPIFDDQRQLLFFVELLRPVPLASGNIADQQMIGTSQAFLKMLEVISRVGQSDVSVVLRGESGTGKELAARAIHMASTRSDNPMVTLECSGLTDSLFESELFGHVKGAFTGAQFNKPGLIEQANGGTLFLDEVADIPLPMQVKLLRLLETGTYRPVGSSEIKNSNFRLICASHKNLAQMVDQASFRQDLFYRINVFPVHLPSLAERRDDIPAIAKSLIHRISPDQTWQLTQPAMERLSSWHYKGNIRELRNVLARATVLAETHVIDLNVINKCFDTDHQASENIARDKVDLKTAELAYLQNLMTTYGDKEKAAQVAGISVRSLYRKLNQRYIKRL